MNINCFGENIKQEKHVFITCVTLGEFSWNLGSIFLRKKLEQFPRVGNTQFPENIVNMLFHGLFRDKELLGNYSVGFTV